MHYDKYCRTSRYANRYTLPRAEEPAGINTVDKFCTKKTGHRKNECWSLRTIGKRSQSLIATGSKHEKAHKHRCEGEETRETKQERKFFH